MTDRVKGLYVVLDADYRVDDVETIVDAISMVKGVASVDPENFISNTDDYMARARVRSELAMRLNDVIHEILIDQKS